MYMGEMTRKPEYTSEADMLNDCVIDVAMRNVSDLIMASWLTLSVYYYLASRSWPNIVFLINLFFIY